MTTTAAPQPAQIQPTSSHPILGAAMPIELLPTYRDWLMEQGGRDLEIQDGFRPEVLDGDWKPLVAKAKEALQRPHGYPRPL